MPPIPPQFGSPFVNQYSVKGQVQQFIAFSAANIQTAQLLLECLSWTNKLANKKKVVFRLLLAWEANHRNVACCARPTFLF